MVTQKSLAQFDKRHCFAFENILVLSTVYTGSIFLQFDKRHCRAFENILVCLTVYTCSASFVGFIFFVFRRLFWKRERIPCAVNELSIINFEHTRSKESRKSPLDSNCRNEQGQLRCFNNSPINLSIYLFHLNRHDLLGLLFLDRSLLISISVIVLICLPQISMTIIPASSWFRRRFFLCCGLVPLLPGEKCIQLSIYFQEKRRVYADIFTIIR